MPVTIGAGVDPGRDRRASRCSRAAYPALTTAAGMVGGPQIRNMGTLGGNLCQRNRCWYFRDEHVHCLLKGGKQCFALDGENRYHAIFTQGHKCVIVNPSTLAPVLLDSERQRRGPRAQGQADRGAVQVLPGADRSAASANTSWLRTN